MDGKAYTIKNIAEMWHVSKTTINRYISELDADYIKQHTHTARNRTIIDAELYDRLHQIYNAEPIQIETEELQQVATSQQIETEKSEQLKEMLQHFETKLKLFETSERNSETLLKHLETENEYLKSQLEKKDAEIQNLKKEYISQLESKDDQIKELHTLLDQQQQLHKAEQDQKQLLIEKSNDDSADAPERKGFFKRLFRK